MTENFTILANKLRQEVRKGAFRNDIEKYYQEVDVWFEKEKIIDKEEQAIILNIIRKGKEGGGMKLVDAKVGETLKTADGKLLTVVKKEETTIIVKSEAGTEFTLPLVHPDELELVTGKVKSAKANTGKKTMAGTIRGLIEGGGSREEVTKKIVQEFKRDEKWVSGYITSALGLWQKRGLKIEFKK